MLAIEASPQQPAAPKTGADLIDRIRSAGLDPAQCYRVRDLSLSKEDIGLYFTDGYLILSKPVNGERLSAVFSADVDEGDGEVVLLPPYRGERQSLAKFTHSPNMDEHFRAALLIFTDGSAQTLLDQITKEQAGRLAPEMGPVLAEQWAQTLSDVRESFALRLAGDLLTPPESRRGLFFAGIAGIRDGNFDLFYDTRAQEQIAAGQLVDHKGRLAYDIWTSFPARSYRTGTSKPASPEFSAGSYRIEAALDADLQLSATVHATIRVGANPIRALPLEISRAIEITSARIDGVPAEALFRESVRERALRDGENDPFLLVAPQALAPGSVHQVDFEEKGSVIASAGKDVYFVAARANWYPRNGMDFSTYDLSFRYPRRLTLVTPGDVMEDRTEGDWRFTRRVTPVPIRLAGFNLGNYEKVSGSAPGFHVEVYGNRNLEAALQPRAPAAAVQETEGAAAARPGPRGRGRGPSPSPAPLPQMPMPPDPLARLRTVAADVSSALRFYSGLFGPPGMKSLTVSPIPAAFGQGFPGLVYLSTLAYLAPDDRPAPVQGSREEVFFSDLLDAHEVAHQWWGDSVYSAGYQDEWLTEALANYSALLYLEKKKGPGAIQDVLADYRDHLLKKDPESGRTVESTGPITWGYRLESAGPPDAWRAITYDKGTWVLHMLRLRMGDERFLKMLAELRRRFDSRPVSTLEFRDLVKEFLPRGVTPASIDEFFDNWVYSTGIPALKLTYTVKGAAPSIRISGQIEQSGVDDGFSVKVPVEIQFAQGPAQIVWVETSNDGATFSATVRQRPLRASISAAGILATKK